MMNSIEKLIAEMCPDGVEYKKLEEALDYEQPTKYIVSSTEYDDSYDIPVLTAGQSFILGYTDETSGIYDASKEKPVIIFDDFTTSFHWVDFPFKVKSSAMKMLRPIDERKIDFKYTYYAMTAFQYVPSEHSRQWIGTYSQFEIPVPPIEVQKEIVRILDKLTELETKLTEELEARKKQYEYYLNEFYSIDEHISCKIGELTRVFSASRVHKDEWTKSGVRFWRSSDVIAFHNGIPNTRGEAFISNELYEKLSAKSGKIYKDCILVTGGGSIGIPYLVPDDEPLYVKDADLLCIEPCEHFISKYLYFYFFSPLFRKYLESITHDATIAHYTITQILETEIPIPSLEEQEHIVKILDTFNTLCNDTEKGLPAEIAARHKQYEYYRDKLLTFERKAV